MKKDNISKSVRLSPDLVAYIDAQPGKDFTGKLNGLLMEVRQGEAKRKKELAYLDAQISNRRKELSGYVDVLMHVSRMRRDISGIEHRLSTLLDALKALTDKSP